MLEMFFIAGFTIVAVGLTIFLVRSLSLILALHTLTFVLMTTAVQTASLALEPRQYQIDILLLLLALLGLYLLVIFLGAPVFKSLAGDTEELLRAVVDMSPAGLCWLMVGGLAIKAYLLLKYGVVAFALLSTPEATIASVDAAVGALAIYPATGAFWATTVVLGCVPGVARRHPILFITWLLFFVWPLLGFGEVGGGRRFIMITVVLAALAAWAYRGYPVSVRVVAALAALSIVTFSLLVYFQAIRTNFEPETIAMLNSRDPGQMLTGIARYLTPPTDAAGIFQENLRERSSPFGVLYDLTDQQVQRLERGGQVLAGGKIITQAVYNVIPRVALPTKETVNADEVLAAVFDFPNVDLAAGLVAFAQAELFALAYLVMPLVMVLLLGLYSRWFRRCAGWSLVLRTSVFSVLISTSMYVEAVPDTLLADARHLLLIGAVVVTVQPLFRLPASGARPAPSGSTSV